MTIQKKFNLLIIWLVLLSLVYLAGFTYTVDCANPVGTMAPSVLDDYIRETRYGFAERLNVDHVFALTGTSLSDADTGYHRDIHFYSTTATDPILDFVTTGGVDELRYTDSAGSAVQFTSAGSFNVALLTSKTITTPTLTSPVLNTGVSGTAVLDEDDMASNSATKIATQQSIKAYVDTQIAAAVPDDDAFGAWASKSNNTSYLAESDGFVVAMTNDSAAQLSIYTDSANPPTTLRVSERRDYATTNCICPVKKGDYWKTTGASTVFWLPIGG